MSKAKYRVITFLNRADIDYLDEIEKDIYFTHGIHIPRATLIQEIINVFQESNDKEKIEQELLNRYKEGLGRRQP